ncbi:MAG: hypothetical protein M3548_01880, partial [Actinomycetota bacterium]|nr:hypothetical protein [Actinomycetota bacterium]
MSKGEAPAVHPPTDVPAIEDPPTARALRGLRLPLIGLPLAVVAFGVPAIALNAAGAGWVGVAALT